MLGVNEKNMKKLLWLVMALIIEHTFADNTSTISIPVYYSQNGKYCAKSILYGYMARGKTIIYKTSNKKILYTIPRCFTNIGKVMYALLSNDGKTIVYFNLDVSSSSVDSLKPIVVYYKGKLVQAYTTKDITGIKSSGWTSLLYYNKNIYKNKDYKTGIIALKDSINEEEIFLKDYALFSNNDTIYITDPNKIVHKLHFGDGKFYKPESFENAFCRLKKLENRNKIEVIKIPYFEPRTKDCFPLLNNGDTVSIALANKLGMKAVYLDDIYKYKSYSIEIVAMITRLGDIKIEKLVVDKKLPYDKVRQFFENSKYKMDFLPKEMEKRYYTFFFGRYRNLNDSIAEQETIQDKLERQLERERRMTLDSVEGKYIPKNIEECFIELDKILDSDVKEEMKNLRNCGEMIRYHHGLGTWIRNNWGLWGGSRLLKYFQGYGYKDPDSMSGIILDNYYSWLHGKTNIKTDWENANPKTNDTRIYW